MPNQQPHPVGENMACGIRCGSGKSTSGDGARAGNMNVNGICTAENIEEQKQCLHYRRSCVYKHELCADLKFNTKRCDSRKANKE